MIKEVYLFTNRNLLAFDEHGEQVIEVQKAIGWKPKDEYRKYQEQDALGQIITDRAKIYLCKFNEWCHQITPDELCSLLGHGPWYWDNYKEKGSE